MVHVFAELDDTKVAIAACEGQISSTTLEISRVEALLSKPGLNAAEVMYLRRDKEQLRKKEEQLRKEKELLLQRALPVVKAPGALASSAAPDHHYAHPHLLP